MNVAIIKFNSIAMAAIRNSTASVVSICDPSAGGMAWAAMEYPKAARFYDYSNAIGFFGVDAVLISIQDKANEIALTAIAYGKHLLLAGGIEVDRRLYQISARNRLSITKI